MVGKYFIEVYNNRVHYEFQIKRNITIIQGNSATGKTTLVEMIASYERLGKSSGITLKCDTKCAVLGNMGWKSIIAESNDVIFFVEENMPFIKTKEFAEAVSCSDNYFVLIYRDSLPQLSYSIDEIYGINEDRGSQKYIKTKKVYNSFYKIYNLKKISDINPDVVITEDTNSGYEFFNNLFNCKCISGNGKSNVHKVVEKAVETRKLCLAIVDGAAFGADIQRLIRTIADRNCLIYAPESFEYLLLSANILEIPKDIIENTQDYADSKYYSSWERFYTDKLIEITKNTVYRYSKHKLNSSYRNEKIVEKVKAVMPDIILDRRLSGA